MKEKVSECKLLTENPVSLSWASWGWWDHKAGGEASRGPCPASCSQQGQLWGQTQVLRVLKPPGMEASQPFGAA